MIDDKNLSWPFYPPNEVTEREGGAAESTFTAFVGLSNLEPALSPSVTLVALFALPLCPLLLLLLAASFASAAGRPA